MRLCYFGIIVLDETFSEMSQACGGRISTAGQAFQRMLINGLSYSSDVSVEVNTYPPVPAACENYAYMWGRRREQLTARISAKWLPAINIQVVKQLCFFISTILELCSWLQRSRDNKRVILVCAAYPPVVAGVLIVSKTMGCSAILIETDLPEYALYYSNPKGLKAILVPLYVAFSKLVRSCFDGYVLLTEQMNSVVNTRRKPYVVVEGMVNADHL